MPDHADLLRRAAAKARETAQAAPRGPYTVETPDPRDYYRQILGPDGDPIAATRQWAGGIGDDTGNPDQTGAHIALWHPGVALAVATWLEDAARAAEENRDGWPEASYQKDPDWYENLFASEFHHPLAVARALLNHPEDT